MQRPSRERYPRILIVGLVQGPLYVLIGERPDGSRETIGYGPLSPRLGGNADLFAHFGRRGRRYTAWPITREWEADPDEVFQATPGVPPPEAQAGPSVAAVDGGPRSGQRACGVVAAGRARE